MVQRQHPMASENNFHAKTEIYKREPVAPSISIVVKNDLNIFVRFLIISSYQHQFLLYYHHLLLLPVICQPDICQLYYAFSLCHHITKH